MSADARSQRRFAAGLERATPLRAFGALCARDLWVTVRHEPVGFLSQALLQPLFFLFVFGRVLPRSGPPAVLTEPRCCRGSWR